VGKDAVQDWEHRWSHVAPKDASVSPFDKAAARLHSENQDAGEASSMPEPTPILDGVDLDVEAERKHQLALDQIIAGTKIAVNDDSYRNEQIRQRTAFLAAEERLKAAVGSDDDGNFLPPEAGEYDPAPKAATGFVVVQAKGRRKGAVLTPSK
jgi:hypothetical protein